jgi:DNA-binding LytR/AlgR family response regulator
MVNTWRVILVDDEPLARLGLRHCLTLRHLDFEIVGEAESMLQARQLIQQDDSIDGVFLDINIETEPDRAGLDFGFALNNLPNPPWVVFVTGYEKYAVEAINHIKPIDYLLKPLEQTKVDALLDWIRKNRRVKAATENAPPPRIEVRHKIRRKAEDGCIEKLSLIKFLLPEEILFVCSNAGAGAIEVHLVNGEVLKDVNITLKSWLNYALPRFIQTSKSAIVNLKYVSGYRLDVEKEGSYLLQFKDHPAELAIGASFFGGFKEALKTYS